MRSLLLSFVFVLGVPTLAHAGKCRAELFDQTGAKRGQYTNSKGCEEARSECLSAGRSQGLCNGFCRDERGTKLEVTCSAPKPKPPRPPQPRPEPPRPPQPRPEPPRPPRPWPPRFEQVICAAGYFSGQAIPTRVSDGVTLGSNYYPTMQACEYAIRQAERGIVCAAGYFSGQAVPVVVETAEVLGQNVFSDLQSCVRAVESHRNGLICLPGFFSGEAGIYNYRSHQFLDRYFRPSLQNCIDALP